MLRMQTLKNLFSLQVWFFIYFLLWQCIWSIVRIFLANFDYRIDYPQDGWTEFLYLPYERTVDVILIILGLCTVLYCIKRHKNLIKITLNKKQFTLFLIFNGGLFLTYEAMSLLEKIRIHNCVDMTQNIDECSSSYFVHAH